MNTEQYNLTKQKVITTTAMLVFITILALGAKALPSKPPGQSAASSGPAISSSSASSSANSSSTYKDGTYTATGTYDSPGGTQSIDISLTVASNTVTDAVVKGNSSSGVTQTYQSDFVAGYKQFVVGKKLQDIRVSRVSGSSLTSNGFNKALKQIESQAKI